MQQVMSWLNSGWSIAMVIIGLGLIVFLHELGHFLMAKKNGVRVEIFSLGFGQAIWKFRRGETEYRIAWLPLGGYVKMSGESLMDDRKGEPFELTSKTPWQRFQIFVAGAAMNLIIAFPIAILAYVVGKCEAPNEIGRPGIAERRAGILPGDVILEVDGRTIDSLDKFRVELIRHPTGTKVPVKLRRGQEILTKDVEAMNSSFHHSSPPSTMIADPVPDSPLAKQGVQGRDEIVSVNGKPVYSGRVADELLKSLPGQDAAMEFRRRGLTFEKDDELRPVKLTMPKKTWYTISRDENLGEARVGMVADGRPATPFLRTGDRIVRIADRKVESWVDLKEVVEGSAGKPLDFVVQRGDETKTFTITPQMGDRGVGEIGVVQGDSNVLALVKPDSYFARMGLKSGDKLISFDGYVKPTLGWNEKEKIPGLMMGMREEKDRPVPLEVERDGKLMKLALKLEPKEEGDLAAAGFKTIEGNLLSGESQPFRRRALGDAVKAGLIEPVDITVMTFDILKKLLTGGESTKGLSGPIGIIHASYSFAQLNFGNFVWLLCLITVNLGIFNLLPIPILDGGHNVLLLIEVVRKWLGKPPPSEKFVAAFQYVGLAFILTLFVFVTYNDISRFISRG